MLAPHQKEIVGMLKSQSTWRLVFLSVLTLGIYTAFYAKRQSRVLNGALATPEHRMKDGFILFLMVSAFVSAGFDVLDSIYGESWEMISGIASVGDFIFGLSILFWTFMACGRLNYVLGLSKGDPLWSNKLWSFLFGAFYFNFRVNKLYKAECS